MGSAICERTYQHRHRGYELTGRHFSHLTVLSRSSDHGNGKKPVTKWICRCDCGKLTVVRAQNLISGHTKSCGCARRKHGFSHNERLYEIWKNMRRRCFDKRNKRWAHYGGKGIRICKEWDDYGAFRKWAYANGYTENLTIDRIDVNGNYCPENCRWADAKTQANNTTRNHWIEYEGNVYTMSQFAKRLGLSYSALQHRIDRHWGMDRIVSQQQRRW